MLSNRASFAKLLLPNENYWHISSPSDTRGASSKRRTSTDQRTCHNTSHQDKSSAGGRPITLSHNFRDFGVQGFDSVQALTDFSYDLIRIFAALEFIAELNAEGLLHNRCRDGHTHDGAE